MRTQRRQPDPVRSVAILAALALVAGGALVLVDNDTDPPSAAVGAVANGATIVCPDLTESLRDVPDAAKQKVDETLAALDVQIADSYDRLLNSQGGSAGGGEAVLADLTQRRQQALAEVSGVVARASSRPVDLTAKAPCRMLASEDPGQGLVSLRGRSRNGDNDQLNGLTRRDFVNILAARPDGGDDDRSGGVFIDECGRNENGHLNPDNFIVAPGVNNGAHHMHDYVGNVSTDGFSTNRSLAASGTTCRSGDQSAFFWPVLRELDGSRERDARAPGGGKDKNVGRILEPTSVTLGFERGSGGGVTAMPRFLRIITGDAKAFTNDADKQADKGGVSGKAGRDGDRGGRDRDQGGNQGGGGRDQVNQGGNQGNQGGQAAQAAEEDNANASWSCTGFEDRQLKDKYPICPEGSQVVRTLEFPSCWDGKNIDSANHRTHVEFPRGDGRCRNGFRAIPELTMRLTYDVQPNSFFAIDSFPEQLHKPVTDHGDFTNVMPERLMDQVVDCINSGRKCGS